MLEGMLIRRNVTARNEVFTVHLGVQEADFTRNAIVKSLYEVRVSGHEVYYNGVAQLA